MKLWQKISPISFHAVMLAVSIYILVNGFQLRWRLGYIIFWSAALSGIVLYFVHCKKYIWNALIKLYAFCWGLLALVGGIITYLTHDPVYCETDKYIMKHPASIIGFDSAILYEKKGMLEIERYRYKGIYPQSMIPLDSIGAIVIFGEFNNGETLEKDVSILPLDDSFDEESAKEYALKHNIRI
ncbi:MAG: hypothetical protein J6B03_03555 [Candidatus Homeothermus sp.]|nr:hypothetical protein [Candidatus Homeothermus sp.]